MRDEVATPAVQPADTEPELEVWRSMDGRKMLIKVGYTDFALSSAAAVWLAREILQAYGK